MNKPEIGQFISEISSALRGTGPRRIYGDKQDTFEELQSKLSKDRTYQIGFDAEQQKPFAEEVKNI